MDTAAVIVAVVAAVLGAVLAWSFARARYAPAVAAVTAERDVLRGQVAALDERVQRLRSAEQEAADATLALAPVTEALRRVERQVGVLERDRVEHFGQLAERLGEVTESTRQLRTQTASLAGSLNASTVRGAWGETQLRRVLEHAGLLARCDFDEQAAAVTREGTSVRPDVVVRLPGGKTLVVDAKAPLTSFLSAQAEGLSRQERDTHLAGHAAALRGHAEALARKEYWTAFTNTPEMVVCFVPGDAILAAALSADPSLFEEAMARRVVLASPSTLIALLRTVAFTWQQEAITENARELLELGRQLHARLATLGVHATKMGASLRRSVESYNALVGALESRVLVTARRLRDLDATTDDLPRPEPLVVAPRPLSAAELLGEEATAS